MPAAISDAMPTTAGRQGPLLQSLGSSRNSPASIAVCSARETTFSCGVRRGLLNSEIYAASLDLSRPHLRTAL